MAWGPFAPSTRRAVKREAKTSGDQQGEKMGGVVHPERDVLEKHDCIVDVSEIRCGDPNCAPIDKVVPGYYLKGTLGTFCVLF